jgi:hypothetical protein
MRRVGDVGRVDRPAAPDVRWVRGGVASASQDATEWGFCGTAWSSTAGVAALLDRMAESERVSAMGQHGLISSSILE